MLKNDGVIEPIAGEESPDAFGAFFDEAVKEPIEGKDPANEKLPTEEKLPAGEEELDAEKEARKEVKALLKEGKTVEDLSEEQKPIAEKIIARRAEKEAEEKQEKEEKMQRKAQREKAEVERIATVAREVAALRKDNSPAGPTEAELLAAQEDEKHMAAFAKDWPDQAKAMEILQKGTLRDVEKVLGDILKPLFEKIPGLEKQLGEVTAERAWTSVLQEHPDAYKLVNSGTVDAWIGTLPNYLQKAMNDTLDNGSPEDMIDLMNDFKEAIGRTKVAKTEEEIEKEKTEKDKKAGGNKERLQSMSAVKTARSTIDKGSDPNDFDSAFEEFVK